MSKRLRLSDSALDPLTVLKDMQELCQDVLIEAEKKLELAIKNNDTYIIYYRNKLNVEKKALKILNEEIQNLQK
jgi:hypothetical protein